jgi:hypothetical protein
LQTGAVSSLERSCLLITPAQPVPIIDSKNRRDPRSVDLREAISPKPKVYVETSILSYLAARPSRDPLPAETSPKIRRSTRDLAAGAARARPPTVIHWWTTSRPPELRGETLFERIDCLESLVESRDRIDFGIDHKPKVAKLTSTLHSKTTRIISRTRGRPMRPRRSTPRQEASRSMPALHS